MAEILSKVESNVQKLHKIKGEIEGVKKVLKGINIKVDVDIAKGLEAQLKLLENQYHTLVTKIVDAEGKIVFLMKSINDASKSIIQEQVKVSKSVNTSTQVGDVSIQTYVAEAESVQIQAKAYENLRAEINDILDTRDANVKRMMEEMNAIRLINAEIKEITKSQENLSSLSFAQQKRLEQLNNSLLAHKVALSEVRQSLNDNVKLDNVVTISINELSQSLSRMKIAYRELTEEERNSPIGKELLASINQADMKIKELDATIGNHQRNIGSYGNQRDMVGMSIQQVGRELPSLDDGPKVLFTAISNNLPILADEIKRARTEYELLKKSGQTATPIWKQVISSLFSWQTALKVGITLFTLYGDKIIDWIDGLFKVTDVTKPLVDSQKQLNDVQLKGAQTAQSEVSKLDLLYKATQNAAKPIRERKKAVDELQKSYPDFFKSFSDEEIMAGKAADAYTRLASAIIVSARARAANDKMTENAKKILENEAKITEEYIKREDAQLKLDKAIAARNKIDSEANPDMYSGQQMLVGAASGKVDEIDTRIANLRREIYETNKAQYELAQNINVEDLVFNANEDSSKQTEEERKKHKEETDKLRQEQKKYRLLISKQELDYIRANEDLQMQTDQARINAMREGNVRTLEQMKLDHEKEMQQLDRQQEDLLLKKKEDAKAAFDAKEDENAAEDSNYEKKNFDGSNITLSQSEKNAFDNQKMYLSLKQFGETQAILDKERQAWNDYLAEYGTFQKKKDAITAQYNERIANSSTKGEKESLKKERDEKLKEVNFEELKSSINFADVFGDLDAQSTDAITRMRDKLKEIIDASAKDLKPTDLKALQDALSNIDLKMAERNPFGELKQGIDKYKASTHTVIKAQEDLNTVQRGGEVIVGSYIDSTGKIVKKLLSQTQAENNLDKAQSKRQDALASLTKAANSTGSQGMEIVNAGNQIVDMLGNFGIAVPEAVSKTLDGIGQTMGALESIDFTKPFSAITGSIGILTGIGNTIAGLFGFSGADYSGYEDMKAQYENLISIWDKLIDKKMEYIDIDYGKEALKAANEAEAATNIQISRQRQLIKQLASSGASVGSHSLGYRIDHRLSKEDYQRLSDLAGEKISAEYQLWDLSSEQIEKILTDEKLVSVLDAVNKDFVPYLQNIADYGDKLDEIAEKEKEAIAGMGFDEFRDGYVDLLSDLDSTNEDFADNFEKYLQKAIFQSLIANEYKQDIEDLYNSWAQAGKDGLTSEEAETLRKKQQDLTNSMLAKREELMNSFGWESDSDSTREASQKGIATASQESVDENNGRLAVMQEHTYTINENVAHMATGIDTIISYVANLSYSTNTDKATQSILNMRDAALSHLTNIDNNTARLATIESTLASMKNGIDTLNIKGITIKK